MIKNVIIFAVGIMTGTVVGSRIVKKRYEEMANDEIEEIRAYYKEREKEQKVEVKEIEQIEQKEESVEITDEERTEYNNIRFKYTTETTLLNKENDKTDVESTKSEEKYDTSDIYVIDPSEYGNEGKYAVESLTYFADGVLVNEVDEVIEEYELVVGRHHIDIFNEFPDATCVYIRNDWEGMDYEVLKDDWCWSDIQEPEKKPHQL